MYFGRQVRTFHRERMPLSLGHMKRYYEYEGRQQLRLFTQPHGALFPNTVTIIPCCALHSSFIQPSSYRIPQLMRRHPPLPRKSPPGSPCLTPDEELYHQQAIQCAKTPC